MMMMIGADTLKRHTHHWTSFASHNEHSGGTSNTKLTDQSSITLKQTHGTWNIDNFKNEL